jgi:uncharacterized protein (TIGR02145 family)
MKMNKMIGFYSIVVLIWLSMATTSCEKALYEEDQPVTDIDGNTYKTVKIGNQVWMAENLKVTKYSDGIPLTLITSQAGWDDISIFTKAYIWDEEYGVYYSGAAAINENSVGSAKSVVTQGVCPTGWHIPDYEEWMELVDFLGGSEFAGGKLKESGSVHWRYPNIRGSNESGFTALAGGEKIKSSRWIISSSYKGHSGYWWSSDQGGLSLSFYTGAAFVTAGSEPSLVGKTVRCLKD